MSSGSQPSAWHPMPGAEGRNLERLRVPGGWLVREVLVAYVWLPAPFERHDHQEVSVALTFVPDPLRQWEGP